MPAKSLEGLKLFLYEEKKEKKERKKEEMKKESKKEEEGKVLKASEKVFQFFNGQNGYDNALLLR